MNGSQGPHGAWPPPPGWPPEFPPTGPPTEPPDPRPPEPRPVYPPVPMVYEEAPTLQNLADRLLDQRLVMVTGHLDLARATEAAARVMLLDGSGDDPIQLVLSCRDGDLIAAMALADTVELVGVEVRSLCSGSIGGPALLPFAVASRRLAQPHATFQLNEPTMEIEGRSTDISSETALHADLLADMHRRLAAASGKRVDTVAEDLRRRRFLSAVEAKAYGLVDEILRPGHLRSV
jgi:ATP-dependent Clp protease protease subunit